MGQAVPMSNEEIEVACDLLWFVSRVTGLTPTGEALWRRLQPIRHGDFGGNASTELSRDEARAIVAAGESTDRSVPLEEDESALVRRLRSLLL